MNAPMDYQLRVMVERDDLQDKFDKLTEFLASDRSRNVHHAEILRLTRQKSAMQLYLDILNERLEAMA